MMMKKEKKSFSPLLLLSAGSQRQQQAKKKGRRQVAGSDNRQANLDFFSLVGLNYALALVHNQPMNPQNFPLQLPPDTNIHIHDPRISYTQHSTLRTRR